jgi:hypothetical protein
LISVKDTTGSLPEGAVVTGASAAHSDVANRIITMHVTVKINFVPNRVFLIILSIRLIN